MKKYVLNTTVPFLTATDVIGLYPVESDIFVHFHNAFDELGFENVGNCWLHQRTKLENNFSAMAEKIQSIAHDSPIIAFNSINYGSENVLDGQVQNFIKNLKKNHKNIISLTFIPDVYPKRGEDIIKIIQECLEFSDLIIVPYIQITEFIEFKKIDIDTTKIMGIPCVPTKFIGDMKNNPKIIDFAYMGTAKGLRMQSLKELISYNSKTFISTISRVPIEQNPTRKVSDYLKILGAAKLSINTFAHPAFPIGKLRNFTEISAPGVLPGRVAESISASCIPFFVYEGPYSEPLILGENIENKLPIWGCTIDTLKREVDSFLSGYSSEQVHNICKSYHQDYLSSFSILNPVLEKLNLK